MAEFAKKKLLTSKGVIRSGQELPDNLPKGEVDAIRKAGGLEEQRRPAKPRKGETPDAIAAAEKSVADAKADLAAVGEDLAKKAEAEKALAAAEAELAKLKA